MKALRILKKWSAALLVVLGFAQTAEAYNQDHYFLYKTSSIHNNASGISVGPDDKIYVTEWGGARVVIYDKDLNFLSQITGFNASDVAVSEDGTVYVASSNSQKVRKYDSGGNYLGDLCSGFPAERIRIQPGAGNIYIRYSGGNYKIYKPDGTLVKSFSLSDGTDRFEVRQDGKLHLADGTLWNDVGIQEKSGLIRGYCISYRGGSWYTSNSDWWGWWFTQYNADYTPTFQYGWYNVGIPYGVMNLAVNHQGDVITMDGGSWVAMYRRCEGGSMGPEVRNAAPMPEVTSISQRQNSTLLDIDFKVTDLDDATVSCGAMAFSGNMNSFDNAVLVSTLVENTGGNLGSAISTGTTHHLVWDVGTDWGVDFGDISVHIFARDSRQGLMGLHFIQVPADSGKPAMNISRSPILKDWLLEPMMWLVATRNPSVTFSNKQVHGVGGDYDGKLLAYGTTVTLDGRNFLLGLMGAREATADEVQRAKEAATPGAVNQWTTDMHTQKIDRDRPRAVNEYGFDTGGYDSNWFWLVKLN